jgi:hypothetical protein
MLNPFFLQGSKGEQNLIQDLVNEQIKMYGVEVYYLPRQYVNERTVIKEVIESEFSEAYPIEVYLDTYEGFGGQGTILSKFGVQELDDLNIIVSKERFENYIQPLIQRLPKIKLASRPKEGDLIYFPLNDKLFEIKYVEHEKPFYQLQKNYVYELRCEPFRFEDEKINTGISDIDDSNENTSLVQTLRMAGIGSTASAITSIVNGGVRFVTITNRGSGYSTTPSVSFSAAPTGGITATGIATMIGGIIDFCETDETLLRVQGVELSNPGAGYTVAPKIAFSGGGGSGASAEATIGNGLVGIITVTSGGSGYINPPQVTFVGGAVVNAKAVAQIQNGSVTSIRIMDSGLNYFSTPVISISSPNVVGFGTFIYNESVVGSSSSISAIVKSWNSVTRILEVSNLTGEFSDGEILVGQQSGAQYTLYSASTDNLSDPQDSTNLSDGFSQNLEIEVEADKILDFSEKNPFGNP